MRKSFFGNRKGVSIMVGYVLLVVFLIIIAGIVYVWLKTYIPKQSQECPDGTSLFIEEAAFDSNVFQLIVTLKNNGRFNLAGFFIYATNSSEQELPTIDLSGYLSDSSPGAILGNSVLFFEGGENLFSPGSEETYFFDIPSSIGEPNSIRIIPTRFEEIEGKSRFVSCGNTRVEQTVGEPFVCDPYTCEDLGYNCGTWSDGCGGTLNCGRCDSPNVCNSFGRCVPPDECTDTCQTYGYECGTWEICGISTDCGNCTLLYGSGYGCDAMGQCEFLCGNGVIDPGEECDDGNNFDGDGCSSICIIESGFICSGEPSTCENIDSCPSYCISLGYGAGGYCTNSAGNCISDGGIYESGGDRWCTGGSQADTCCCVLN